MQSNIDMTMSNNLEVFTNCIFKDVKFSKIKLRKMISCTDTIAGNTDLCYREEVLVSNIDAFIFSNIYS